MGAVMCLNPLQEIGEGELMYEVRKQTRTVLIPFRKSGRENCSAGKPLLARVSGGKIGALGGNIALACSAKLRNVIFSFVFSRLRRSCGALSRFDRNGQAADVPPEHRKPVFAFGRPTFAACGPPDEAPGGRMEPTKAWLDRRPQAAARDRDPINVRHRSINLQH